jgi:hypothetical protein
MDWEPVLRGDLAVAARNRILEILNTLARLDFSEDSALERADRILLASYLAAAGTELPYGSGVEGLFDTAISSLPPDLPSGIFNGLTSIGWTIQHCTQLSGPPDADDVEIQDPLEDVEQLILARLRVDCWTESYDLVSGLVGIGVYFLERLPAAEASEGLVPCRRSSGEARDDGRDRHDVAHTRAPAAAETTRQMSRRALQPRSRPRRAWHYLHSLGGDCRGRRDASGEGTPDRSRDMASQ